MGQLIAVEGLDGAGKNTLVTALTGLWQSAGLRVAHFTFPRYGQSVHADLASEALHGGHGDLRESVYAMALMFALDRRAARSSIAASVADCDIVVCDRYVASNAAYNAGRLRQGADGEVVAWVDELEFGRFGLPVPDRHVLLGVTPEVAMSRARGRAATDTARERDFYERDDSLQHRVDGVYHQLAQSNWHSPWILTDGSDPDSPAARLRP